MKLRSLTIRNYRVHRDLHVDFDENRTLIGGPNECGKSTLVEALHRGFFLKAKGTTEFHRAMISNQGGEPEVEITFTAGGANYHLKKRFGSRGSTALTPEGRPALLGDEAETTLARLLNVSESIGKRELPGQWSHLWVRQGFSGSDPASEATTQQAPLLQRLQQMGGAVAVQSDLDTSLAALFHTEAEKIFRDDGKAKAGSDLAAAQAQAEDAVLRQQAATDRLGRLTAAIRDFESAVREITTTETQLAALTAQKLQADERLGQVESLRRLETDQARVVKDAKAKQTEFENADQRIARLRADYGTRSEKLAPLLKTTGQLEEAARKARLAAGDSLTKFDSATEAVRTARQLRDFLTAAAAQFEKAEDLRQLRLRLEKVETLQNQLAKLREDLARLPQIDDKILEKLRALETKVSTTAAALKAMAAGLEVMASDQPISVGATTLQAGESLVLTADTEIRIGSGVRLQIRPGGGSSLAQAREDHQAAQNELRLLLEKLGVPTTAEATEAATRRKDAATRTEAVEHALRDSEGDTLPSKVNTAQAALTAAEAETERRHHVAASASRPQTLEAAREQLATAETALTTAEHNEAALKAVREADAQTAAHAEERLTTQKTATDQARGEVSDLEIQLRTLEESHGDGPTRATARAQISEALAQAEAALSVTQKNLADLNADHVAADATRLARAVSTTQQTLAEATTRRAVAQNTLRSDGSEDPQTDLAIETARRESAEIRLAAARRKAEAIRLLDDLFTEEQRSLATQFTQPLADKISGYLECLFGPGARASVVFNDNEFQGLEFARPAAAGGAFRFESLSGGAKEQVAAAMRLAMAEILAAGYDGCLPVTFDDAFAYSDPDRVQSLQRMLDRAAANGLQIIVLTCSPADYVTLGAKKITIA